MTASCLEATAAERGAAIVTELLELFRVLSAYPSLEPAPDVDRDFTRLVRLTLHQDEATARAVLSDPRVGAIRTDLYRLCSKRVCSRERIHALEILAEGTDDLWERVKRAPYFANYEKMTRLEANALFAVAPRWVKRIVLAGSGPFPSTAILLAQMHDVIIDCVEIDAEACEISREMIGRLGLSSRVRVLHADVLEVCLDAAPDAIGLASLVGVTPQEKAVMLTKLAVQSGPDTTLMVRSAKGLKSLLFPEVPLDSVPGFAPVVEIHPHNGIINSLILFQRPDRLFDDVDPHKR